LYFLKQLDGHRTERGDGLATEICREIN